MVIVNQNVIDNHLVITYDCGRIGINSDTKDFVSANKSNHFYTKTAS